MVRGKLTSTPSITSSHAGLSEQVKIINGFILLVSFSIFVGYYSLCSFKVAWIGDINKHVAAVHALYENFGYPMHEGMPVDARYTEVYNPITVAAAAIGTYFHLTPYSALQWIGVVNLLLYSCAVFIYFRTTSVLGSSALPPVFFCSSVCSLETTPGSGLRKRASIRWH